MNVRLILRHSVASLQNSLGAIGELALGNFPLNLLR